jgi:probable rRNA maturation factor
MPPVSIRITSDCDKYKKYEQTVVNSATACVEIKKVKGIVDIHLITDKKMRNLCSVWKGKDETTNVLSFKEPDEMPHPECPSKSVYLGDVYLSPDYIKKNGEDISYLTVHGVLHLLGYTHIKKNDTMIMNSMERFIMKSL